MLSSKQLAEELGISRRTIESWRVTGDGPPYIRLSRSLVRYRRADVEAWLESRKQASTSSGAER